jgi:hypothetical protein
MLAERAFDRMKDMAALHFEAHLVCSQPAIIQSVALPIGVGKQAAPVRKRDALLGKTSPTDQSSTSNNQCHGIGYPDMTESNCWGSRNVRRCENVDAHE